MDGKGGSSEVPEGWQKKRVQDFVGSAESGVSAIAENRSASADELAILTLSAVSDSTFKQEANKAVADKNLVKQGLYPRKGRILISRSNTLDLVGAAVFITSDYPNRFLPDLIWQLEPTEQASVLMKWFAYWLQSDIGRLRLKQIASGSNASMVKISKANFFKIELSAPPLEEQRKIAEILSAWDEALEQGTRLLELKRERKRGLMQQLLTGKVRFRKFEELEWKKVTLNEVSSFIGRGTAPSYIEGDSVAYAVNQKCVRNGSVSIEFARAHDGGAPVKEVSTLQHHDICINSTGTGTAGRIGLWEQPNNDNNYFVDTHVTILRLLHEKAAPKFVADLLQTPQLQNRLEAECIFGGTNQVELSRTDLAKLDINIPPLKEQQKIAAVLSAADAELETLQTQLTTLRTQKRGLMQQLLTGKTRVQPS